MPQPITLPATGIKHSESISVTTLGGDELVLGIRPQAADPTKFENVNLPAALLGAGAPVSLSLTAAQARISAVTVAPPTFYAISANNWNASTTAVSATVYVFGITPDTYAPTGWVIDQRDHWQIVKVDVGAGTFDTEELRGLWVKQYSEVDPTTGNVDLWLGPAVTVDGVIKVVMVP